MGKVIAVCTSQIRGVQKENRTEGWFEKDWGIRDDAHAGHWHRQVSLLAEESIDKMRGMGVEFENGAFAENINTVGIDLKSLPIGTDISVGEAVLTVTQIGKECHNDCEVKRITGKCVMPTEGIFAVVKKGGTVRKGDLISIVEAEK